jgi:signal transduction histidine kinase
VLGDAVQLQQVLVNLLMNGIDAMEPVAPAERRLSVRTSADRDGVHLEVADAGPGLDPEIRSRLFEPFFTTKPSGLGMGLAICRSIVQAHGGHIRLAPRPGPGTTIQIRLPARSL